MIVFFVPEAAVGELAVNVRSGDVELFLMGHHRTRAPVCSSSAKDITLPRVQSV